MTPLQDREYLVGHNPQQRMWIGYRPPGQKQSEAVCFQVDVGPGAHGSVLSPEAMLRYRPGIYHEFVVNGVLRSTPIGQEEPGWFERKCVDAGCGWFVPLLRRMAAGEDVSIEEVQAEYFAHNGKPMPSGGWSQLFQ